MRKIRASQIVIDMPTEDAPVWVWATWQRCIKDADYRTTQTVDGVLNTNASLSSFAMQIESVVDPVTGQTVTASGAAVAMLIKQLALTWALPRYPGSYVNDQGDLIEST